MAQLLGSAAQVLPISTNTQFTVAMHTTSLALRAQSRAHMQDMMKQMFGDVMLVQLVMMVSSKHQANGIARKAPYTCCMIGHEPFQSDSADLRCPLHGVPLLIRAAA